PGHDEREDGAKQDHRQGAGPPEMPELEHFFVHAVGDHFGVEAAVGHHVYNVENFQHVDDHGGGHDGDGRLDRRVADAPEHLPFVGAVDTGRFEQFFRNSFIGGREDHHAKAGPDPHTDCDEGEVVDPGPLDQPTHGLSAQPYHDLIQKPNLRGV